jgi:hypothetical protein
LHDFKLELALALTNNVQRRCRKLWSEDEAISRVSSRGIVSRCCPVPVVIGRWKKLKKEEDEQFERCY